MKTRGLNLGWPGPWSPRPLIAAGLGLRLVLIAFAALQDTYFKVPYTDIDYQVYTDAALHIYEGRSPFAREAYRYSPLIALLVVPNHAIHPAFGKVLFVFADVVIAILQCEMLVRNKVSHTKVTAALAFWLFNPFTFAISSRGSSDSISSLCLVLMLSRLDIGRHATAGFWFGLAVHLRLFPVIYAPPLLLFLSGPPRSVFSTAGVSKVHPVKAVARGAAAALTCWGQSKLAFVACSLAACTAFTWLSFCWCGQEYIDEALLYHFGRFDLAHNFSPWFYIFGLMQEGSLRNAMSIAAFVPQLFGCVFFGVVLDATLPQQLCLSTMWFVALNKVVTAQYFAWYLVLLPLVIPSLAITTGLLRAAAFWVVAQLNWLFWAYLLEFEQIAWVKVFVFAASLLFLSANLFCIHQLVKADQHMRKGE